VASASRQSPDAASRLKSSHAGCSFPPDQYGADSQTLGGHHVDFVVVPHEPHVRGFDTECVECDVEQAVVRLLDALLLAHCDYLAKVEHSKQF
jgi:hypothetical protein